MEKFEYTSDLFGSDPFQTETFEEFEQAIISLNDSCGGNSIEVHFRPDGPIWIIEEDGKKSIVGEHKDIENTEVVKVSKLGLDWLNHIDPNAHCFAYNHHDTAILEIIEPTSNSENETHDLEMSWEEAKEWFKELA